MTQTNQIKTPKLRFITISLSALVMTLVFTYAIPGHAGVNDGVDGLTEAQQAFAARTLQFIDKMDAKYFARAAEIDDDLALTSKDFNYDYALYEVKVGRGSNVEKIGRMTGIVFEPTDPIQDPTVFGRYFGIDVHARNPRVGLLHAAFLVQYYPDGKSAIGGTLNIVPGAARKEDLSAIKAALDEVFEKHGIDGTPLRRRVCEGTEMAVDKKYRRRLACVGASFFGGPMLSVTEENFQFITEAYDRFVDAYMTVLAKRTDARYTEENIAAQDAMRLNWFEDQMFADPYAASGITPYEVWSMSFTPPVVKF